MWILNKNYEKTNDSIRRPRVSRHGMQSFLCIVLYFFGVLHYVLLEESQAVVSDVYKRQLEAKMCGFVFLLENARLHTINQPENRSFCIEF